MRVSGITLKTFCDSSTKTHPNGVSFLSTRVGLSSLTTRGGLALLRCCSALSALSLRSARGLSLRCLAFAFLSWHEYHLLSKMKIYLSLTCIVTKKYFLRSNVMHRLQFSILQFTLFKILLSGDNKNAQKIVARVLCT